MNKFFRQLQRLYFLPGQASEAANTVELLNADGKARAMVINFEHSSDWPQLGNLYQALQADLDLPAPAISVSGNKGYGLWFSLSEPLAVAEIHAFLKGLRDKYLSEIPVHHLDLRPGNGTPTMSGSTSMLLPAAPHTATEKWSAFIDPTLGSMFIDEPWLGMAPNTDKQADILHGLQSMHPDDLQRAIAALQSPEETKDSTDSAGETVQRTRGKSRREALTVGSHYSDPASFLLAVMNDSSASTAQRIKAAKALLPYFAQTGHGQTQS